MGGAIQREPFHFMEISCFAVSGVAGTFNLGVARQISHGGCGILSSLLVPPEDALGHYLSLRGERLPTERLPLRKTFGQYLRYSSPKSTPKTTTV